MDLDSDSPAARYAPFAALFTIGGGALVHLASRRRPGPTSPLEFAEAALATFFLTRTVAREKIGSVVREPFVEPAPGADPDDAHGEAKQPTGRGIRYTIGELVTCTRCLGPWVASGMTFGAAFAPQHTRVATRLAALAGANSILHAAFATVTSGANALTAVGDAQEAARDAAAGGGGDTIEREPQDSSVPPGTNVRSPV